MTEQETTERFMALIPLSAAGVDEIHDILFAPWVKQQRLQFLEVEQSRVKARLPQDPQQQFVSGAMCGQALMSAADTVMSLAMLTRGVTRGTTSQNNQFLCAAAGEDLIVEATVLRFGKTIAYGETFIRFEQSGALVMHSTSEFAVG